MKTTCLVSYRTRHILEAGRFEKRNTWIVPKQCKEPNAQGQVGRQAPRYDDIFTDALSVSNHFIVGYRRFEFEEMALIFRIILSNLDFITCEPPDDFHVFPEGHRDEVCDIALSTLQNCTLILPSTVW